jgi:hypothetical protein
MSRLSRRQFVIGTGVTGLGLLAGWPGGEGAGHQAGSRAPRRGAGLVTAPTRQQAGTWGGGRAS